jgi:uncharacterized damage-inducible protein DinB
VSPRERWFDRRFEFALPVARFPAVVERLRGTPARVEERVRDLPPAVLARRDGTAWSIQENLGHLLDLEPLWLRRAQQLDAGEAELAPADLTNRRTEEAGHNARPLAALLSAFRAERARLVTLLDAADDTVVARAARHPRLGTPMRLIDLAEFVAEHDDHHLARITELRRLAGA